MAQIQSKKRRRKLLTHCNNELLALKDVLDDLLRQADSLPKEVKDGLVLARDSAWQAFLAEQEKIHQSTR